MLVDLRQREGGLDDPGTLIGLSGDSSSFEVGLLGKEYLGRGWGYFVSLVHWVGWAVVLIGLNYCVDCLYCD